MGKLAIHIRGKLVNRPPPSGPEKSKQGSTIDAGSRNLKDPPVLGTLRGDTSLSLSSFVTGLVNSLKLRYMSSTFNNQHLNCYCNHRDFLKLLGYKWPDIEVSITYCGCSSHLSPGLIDITAVIPTVYCSWSQMQKNCEY